MRLLRDVRGQLGKRQTLLAREDAITAGRVLCDIERVTFQAVDAKHVCAVQHCGLIESDVTCREGLNGCVHESHLAGFGLGVIA